MPSWCNVEVILKVLTRVYVNNLTAKEIQQIIQEEHNIKCLIRCLQKYINQEGVEEEK